MSVAITGMKVIFKGFCFHIEVEVFYHLLGTLVVAQLELFRGTSCCFWVALVTPAMDLGR